MNDGLASLLRLPAEERARALARLRAPGAAPGNGTIAADVSRSDIPASFWQEQLWFLGELAPAAATYNAPFSLDIDGPLDAKALEAALCEIERRHDILRTTLELKDRRVVQRVWPAQRFVLSELDLSSEPEPERAADAVAAALARTALPVTALPTYRTLLLKIDRAAARHRLIWVASHAVADGWSVGVLLRELAALYEPLRRGEAVPLRPLPIQFGDFARWQRTRIAGERLHELLRFWKDTLAGAPSLRLPFDRELPRTQTFEGATHYVPLGAALSAQLESLAQGLQATMFTTLLPAYAMLLAHYAGPDVVIGTAVAARIRPELEPLLGSFQNTIALRIRLEGDPTFTMLAAHLRRVAADAFAHQEMPFVRLVEALQVSRDPGRNPICQTMFLVNAAPLVELETRLGDGVAIRWEGIANGTVKFDFDVAFDRRAEGWRARIDYRTDLFEPSTVERLGAELHALLQRIAERPEARVSELLPPRARPQEPPGPMIRVSTEPARAATPLESLIRELWADALGPVPIGLHDDFFALGGHSLLAAQLVARIRAELGVDLSLQEFLAGCTVTMVASAVERLAGTGDVAAMLSLLERVEQMPDEEIARLLGGAALP